MSMPVDIDPSDFTYLDRKVHLSIIAASVAAQEVDGQEVDVLAIRVQASGAPRGSRPIRTYVLPIDNELAQVVLQQVREANGR